MIRQTYAYLRRTSCRNIANLSLNRDEDIVISISYHSIAYVCISSFEFHVME